MVNDKQASVPRRLTSPWGRFYLWLLLATMLMGTAGCMSRLPRIPTDLSQIGVDFDIYSDLTRLSAGFDTYAELTQIGENFDVYAAEYQARYQLAPRPAGDALAVAEAYMRQYQPGPQPRVFQTTTLTDRHGRLLAELVEEGYRTWVPLHQIAPELLNAVIATEDATFYANPGYDVRRVMGAMVQNAEAGEVVSGASTITMQLARAIFFSPTERTEQSMDRKAYETFLARDLTMLLTKDEILEMYLNLVHFGRQVYGVEAAANLYFGKSAAELTLAEATLLAGIPQRPAEYDLFNAFETVKARQAVVLSLMVRHGFMDQAEADRVAAEVVTIVPEPGAPPVRAPHFVQYVLNELRRAYPEWDDVRRSGLSVVTTLDLDMQTLAQATVAEQVERLRPTHDLSNAALVALKPGSAEILAMVGSADFDNVAISGQVNVTVRLRQPGSAIKPVLYALALDDLSVSPATVIWDVEASYKLSDKDLYRPRNYDATFHGPVTVRGALANSYNVPAVKLLDAVGVPRMLEGARAMGIPSLDREPSWYGLSLTLGGGDVTLLDLTSAFHTLANMGAFRAPQPILLTEGAPNGDNLRLDLAPGQSVIRPESAYLVTDILSDNAARTPAFGANSALRLSKPAAVKTGTTNDYRDNWTLGYTRFLVAGVWAGNSDGRPMRNVSGVTGAAPIWQAFMEGVLADPQLLASLAAPADPADWEFTPPPGVVRQPIACPPGIDCVEEEWFDAAWLDRLASVGPLADSVVIATMNTVYVGAGNVPLGACSAESGTSRQLLSLPAGLTRSLPQPPDAADLPLGEETARRIAEERRAAIAWSAQVRVPLYLGPCDQAEAVARALFGDNRLVVRIDAFTDSVAPREVLEQGVSTPVAPIAAAPPPPSDAPPSSRAYNLMVVGHERGCGGSYVMGTVRNAQGQLVPGVRVRYQDDYGAVQEQTTGSGADAYGAYRFPVLAAGQPHSIYLTILDGAGTAISGRATVPHYQGGATDLGCHFAIWTGAD